MLDTSYSVSTVSSLKLASPFLLVKKVTKSQHRTTHQIEAIYSPYVATVHFESPCSPRIPEKADKKQD